MRDLCEMLLKKISVRRMIKSTQICSKPIPLFISVSTVAVRYGLTSTHNDEIEYLRLRFTPSFNHHQYTQSCRLQRGSPDFFNSLKMTVAGRGRYSSTLLFLLPAFSPAPLPFLFISLCPFTHIVQRN
jgi:hypothetical protein